MANVLMIHPDKCTGCRNCELACSFEHEGQFRPGASRVQAYTWEREGMSVPMMCQQCDDAACITVCPTGAIVWLEGDRVVKGEPLGAMHVNDLGGVESRERRIQMAYRIGNEPPTLGPLVLERIE